MLARLQNIIFVILFLAVMGLLAWASEKYQHSFDLTWGNRNSLTEASIKAIKQLDQPLKVTAFARDDSKGTRDLITDLIERYHQHKADIELEFINPDLVPQLVREHGITVDGELLMQYDKRQETLQAISEKTLTQLFTRFASKETQILAFIEGHGERNPLGQANHDMGSFGEQLASKGFQIQLLNLAKTQGIPNSIQTLIIASPRTAYLSGEIEMIETYIEQGGNLLLLTEPENREYTQAILSQLNIKALPGIVVDATTQLFGIADPTFALAIEYPRHATTETLHSQTLFPKAVGLLEAEESDFQTTPLIQTLPRSWTETGNIEDHVAFDADTEERAGPITIGMALEKDTQRIVVIGDGDFLSNTYLGNGQNLDLGIALFQWLSSNDNLINIGTVSAPDTQLEVSQAGALSLLLVFMILLPLLLLTSGILIWLKRRNQ